MTDFRALCAELKTALQNRSILTHAEMELISRARAALAEGDGVGPSLEEVEDLCEQHEFGVEGYESVECLQGLINDAIARYATHPRPIPVEERLPTEADCVINPRTGQGLREWCWGWTGGVPGVPYAGRWRMMPRRALLNEASHWLPAAAIPLPEASP